MDFQTSYPKNYGVTAKFEWRTKEDKGKSKNEGKTIYKDVAYVTIRMVGDNKNVVSRKVRDDDKKRWPKEWLAFEESKDAQIDGTPLMELEELNKNPHRIAELNALNIYTIESLAHLNDGLIRNLGMDGRRLVSKADAYIKFQDKSGITEKMQEENKQLREKITYLESKINAIANDKPKRGRPPKKVKDESLNDMSECG